MGHYVHASKPLAATGQVQNQDGQNLGRCAVQKIYIDHDLSGSHATVTVVLRDGGASGPILFSATAHKNGTPVSYEPPQRGILFSNGIHATLTNAASVVVFYEG